MTCSKILVLIGLALNTVGAVVVIRRSAFRFIASWFSKEAKGKIVEEAIFISKTFSIDASKTHISTVLR